jgi:hypothetical protein
VIVSGLVQRKVKSLTLSNISDISLTERADGRGSITFSPTPSFFASWAWSWPGMGQQSTPSFEMIEGAKEIYDLINRTKEGPRKGS